MLTSNQSKRIRSLSFKKYREIYRQYLAEGEKIVEELIINNFEIIEIYAISTWLNKNKHLLPKDCEIFEISSGELKSISRQKSPNKVLAVLKIPDKQDLPMPFGKTILLADNLQDPGNLGTIIRTCDWFGINDIICSKETVDVYNPKVIQSTMGSFCRINTYYTNLSDYLKKHNNKTPVYGAFMNGENAFKHDFPENIILLIGNESKGISQELANNITHRITIPHKKTHNNLKPESLNASVAASILISIIQGE